jgi:Tfp pilus assembly ATPase PilU
MNLNQLLKQMVDRGGDLHLTPGRPPELRTESGSTPLTRAPLSAADTAALCQAILSPPQRAELQQAQRLEVSFKIRNRDHDTTRVDAFTGALTMVNGSMTGIFRRAP